MIEDTKTAIAMNSFINFISKTFESYIEVYPVFEFRNIIEQKNNLRKDSSLREKTRQDILISSDLKKAYITRSTQKLTKKIDEKMKKDIKSVENDLICSFKKAVTKSVSSDILNVYLKKMKKNW